MANKDRRKDPATLKRKQPNPPPSAGLKRGRPSVYTQAIDENVRRLCLLGLTDAELAEYLNITPKTMCDWDKAHPSFLYARAEGREKADAEVADSLRKRALGYSHQAERIFVDKGEVIRAEYTQHYPPDTSAASLWLANRQRNRWKLRPGDENAQEHNVTIKIVGGLPDD